MQLTIAALASPANSPPIGSFLPATWIRLKFRSVSSRRAHSGGHKSGERNSTEPIGPHLFASPGADFGWILRRSLVSIVTAKIRAQVTDMNTWLCKTLLWIAVAGCCAPLRVRNTVAATYNLAEVRGMEGFQGATNGLDLLRSNGFVVTDPTFKQIFEAYIQSPQIEPPSETNRFGQSLPAFITTDSAWHTYHILLEEGVKEMELVQAQRLRQFSRQLLAEINAQSNRLGPSANDLSLLTSVGLALQDAAPRQSLNGEAGRLVEALRSGSGAIPMPVGFPLSPAQFRAQSFYTQSPELSDYFAARQWYASVVFRLNNSRETQAAVALASLINHDPSLLSLWRQLSEPFDAFLAPAEDGTVREYTTAATAVLGTNALLATEAQLVQIQDRLASVLPAPRVNDQLLSPEQYSDFAKQTRGFRLLPPRRLPCAVCFHHTTDPKIPHRMYPSGLDFLASSVELRSPAAVRAVRSQFGEEVGNLILQAKGGPLPDSLHGDAMRLLAKLQEPLPAQVPAALRTEAWHDLQLWTQLGAWAEQRHTWALHTKLSVSYMGIVTPPQGMVAPYPEFFSGLAKLARRTAEAFAQAGLEPQFEIKSVATNLLESLELVEKAQRSRDEKELERMSGKLEQLGQFQNRYYEKHQAELEKVNPRTRHMQLQKQLTDLARRCAESGVATEADTETLRMFFDCRQNTARLIHDFAPVCDRLAELARKSLNREALTADDAKWIRDYGITLAGFHFYYGNSYEVPRDDFPIVTRVFSNPLTGSLLYAGLARPQALYVIVPDGKALQLYRGAVLTYREFVRPSDQPLDDESWRALIAKGQTPPAPTFTKSFYAETSVGELLKQLRAGRDDENPNYGDTRDLLWQIGARATAQDLAALFDLMTQAGDNNDLAAGLGEIISRLPWESRQKDLIQLLDSSNYNLASAAARILLSRPEAMDTAALTSAFAEQSPHGRRLICVLLSRLPQPTDATRKLLLQALRDPADGVRWQGLLAIYKTGWNDPQSVAALLASLNDTNELVGAAAAYSLAKLGATNTAPLLFTKLKERLPLPVIASEEQSPQVMAIVKDIHGTHYRASELLNVDRLALRLETPVTSIMKQNTSLRLPPKPIELPNHNYNLADALLEALADLGYMPAVDELFTLRGTDYDAQATRALAKLAPDRLTGEILAVAGDKQVDSYLRERALVTLCNISATNRVRDLIPLLDDTTPIEYSRTLPGPPMRVCDSTARTIAILLGWEHRLGLSYVRPDQREELMARAREWAKTIP